jgi:hypothetical protein
LFSLFLLDIGTFSFGHYVVCSSLIYGFWLPLWCLQTLHLMKRAIQEVKETKGIIRSRYRRRTDNTMSKRKREPEG